MKRCGWATTAPLIEYHDKEWGVPKHDDRGLFELLILEGAQAGLSWETVLKKRNGYRKAFDDFDAKKIALAGEAVRLGASVGFEAWGRASWSVASGRKN